MDKKLKIYLCDLVHNYSGVGSYMFPLNIGYISSFAKKSFQSQIDIKLFKYPLDFINRFKAELPDIVGFSHYTWNSDLNKKMSDWVKAIAPDTITIFGGPNIDHSPKGYRQFFISHNAVDFYIPYQGEAPFVNLLNVVFRNGLGHRALKSHSIDGVLFYNKDAGDVIRGGDMPNIKDLNSIPSPYLTGIMDDFFRTPLIPIMETNRGCPYTCTFCAQGVSSHNRLISFELERVKEEAGYIASKVKNTNILNFADSNFGIADRDIEITRYLASLREKTGYPRKFNTNWAKNQPRLFEIAKILTNSSLIVSLQSLDNLVLKNVKRTNIQLSVFRDIIDKINAVGSISGTEIILGLPGETKQSHINTIRQLFDWDVSYIICYNALILNGTEMSLDREKGAFDPKTKFRLIDNSFGKYDSIISFEAEEGIRSMDTMSEDDILYFRPVHWLIQFMWNYRFYFDLLKYMQSLGINPLDYILKLIDNVSKASTPEKVKKIFYELNQDAKNEWFDSVDKLNEHYTDPKNFSMLEEGRYGKLNGKYVFRVLLEAKEEFEKYLCDEAINYSPICQKNEAVFKDIMDLLSESIIDFTSGWDEITKQRSVSCNYDILAWRQAGYKKGLAEFRGNRISYMLYLPEDQKGSISVLLKQYSHNNKNLMLRKMSEWMDIKDFFYKSNGLASIKKAPKMAYD